MEGGSNVDGDESGGTSPSRQGAGIGILVPRSLMEMAAEIGIASGEKGFGIRVSSTRFKYMPSRAPEEVGAPQAAPRRDQGWGRAIRAPGAPLAPLWPPLLAHESFWSADFYIFFPEFFWQFK